MVNSLRGWKTSLGPKSKKEKGQKQPLGVPLIMTRLGQRWSGMGVADGDGFSCCIWITRVWLRDDGNLEDVKDRI